MTKKQEDNQELFDRLHGKLPLEQYVKLLLWGDKKLGVKGINSRIKRLEKLILINYFITLIIILTLVNLSSGADSSATLLGKLILRITTLLGG